LKQLATSTIDATQTFSDLLAISNFRMRPIEETCQ